MPREGALRYLHLKWGLYRILDWIPPAFSAAFSKGRAAIPIHHRASQEIAVLTHGITGIALHGMMVVSRIFAKRFTVPGMSEVSQQWRCPQGLLGLTLLPRPPATY